MDGWIDGLVNGKPAVAGLCEPGMPLNRQSYLVHAVHSPSSGLRVPVPPPSITCV